MRVNLILQLLIFAFISSLVVPNAFSMTQDEYLDWQHRPEIVKRAIDYSFERIEPYKQSSWNLYNGSQTYDHLNISQLRLAKKIIEDAHKEGRNDVYILDSGAGNFQSCDAFSEYINNHRFVLPKGMTIHIIGTRGERYEGKEIEQIGICKVYKFGSFKIEEHQNELRKRGLELEGKIDLTISNWANRHYVDPLGTWMQFFHTTRPKTGLLIMDWCYYLYEGETFNNKLEAFCRSRDHLLDLLIHINAPFLLNAWGDGWTRDVDRFVVQRENDNPLKLPLAYIGVQECDGKAFDVGSHHFIKFKVLNSVFEANKIRKNFDFLNNKLGYSSRGSLWGGFRSISMVQNQWFSGRKLLFLRSFSTTFSNKKRSRYNSFIYRRRIN